jgi:serine/threonine protein kinase
LSRRHGDLKAGNVLLTANPTPGSSTSCSGQFARSVEVWAASGSQPLSAKVADFGMAMPLGPQDTHATMLARVSVLRWLLKAHTSYCPLQLIAFCVPYS